MFNNFLSHIVPFMR